MSTFKNPVGPQPGSVYWRRRLVVGLGLLVVIVVIILILVPRGSKTPASSVTPGPSTTTSPATAPATTPATPAVTTVPTAGATTAPVTGTAAAPTCVPADVTVTAITDAASYGASTNPKLSLSLTNIGANPCTIDAGTKVQSYVITSGTDVIWSSTDCQDPGTNLAQVLEPNVPITTTPLAWARTRSDAKACDVTQPKVPAAGASYHLNVAVNGIKSAKSKQFLLN